VELERLPQELAAADVVISCTGATDLVITADMLAGTDGRPVFLLDLALPHDVDPAVRALPGVTLVDLETLQNSRIGEGDGDGGRMAAIATARRIVAEEVSGYLDAMRAARVTPTVIALRTKAADVVDAEINRLMSRVPGMEDRVREEVTQTVRRVVDKLLHEPTVRVKQLAASSCGDQYAQALRELFNLDPQVPDAITRAQLDTGGEKGDAG